MVIGLKRPLEIQFSKSNPSLFFGHILIKMFLFFLLKIIIYFKTYM